MNYLLRNDNFFIENTKIESRNPHGGARNPVLWATCPGMLGGARAQYIDRYIYIYICSTVLFFKSCQKKAVSNCPVEIINFRGVDNLFHNLYMFLKYKLYLVFRVSYFVFRISYLVFRIWYIAYRIYKCV